MVGPSSILCGRRAPKMLRNQQFLAVRALEWADLRTVVRGGVTLRYVQPDRGIAMSATARLNLPYIAPLQAQKQVTYNEAMAALD